MVKLRFAPSPTGYLHVGNIRTALLNWLYARKAGGKLVLRLDDTDAERSREEYAQAIEADLTWLGLDWDEKYRQSDRKSIHDAAAGRLRAKGLLYPCYETAEELEMKRCMQIAQHQPPVYDRTGLKLTPEARLRLEAEGRKPHWRFRLDDARTVTWTDLVRGPVAIELGTLSDPVLVREDGSYLYMLPSVVDDIEMGITHIIRGEDHVVNSAVQIALFDALEAPVPTLGHVALIGGAGGEGLSKRLGSAGVEVFRDEGIEPLALLSMLARLGTADPIVARHDHQALIDGFDLGRFGRAIAKFDPAELAALSARLIHDTSYDQVAARLPRVDEAMWLAIRPNVAKISEAGEWVRVINGPITPVIDDPDFIARAADLLPNLPWDTEVWKHWTQAVKAASRRGGRELFMPLRLALTGSEHGPELAKLLPLIGHDRALARLRGDRA